MSTVFFLLRASLVGASFIVLGELNTMKSIYSNQLLGSALLAVAVGCSSGSDGGGTATSGQFVDTLVEGLEYSSAQGSGLTDANGVFQVPEGTSVTFQVGNIVVGTLTSRDVVNLIDLDEDAEDYSSEILPGIRNRARFLQSIDDDQDTSNGIQIAQSTRDLASSVSMDLDDPFWASDAGTTAFFQDLAFPLISTSAATSHGDAWLKASSPGLYGGDWHDQGDTVSGGWRLALSNSGEMVMIITSEFVLEEGESEGNAGAIMPDGKFTISTGSATWAGVVDRKTGLVTGTWEGAIGTEYAGLEGMFSGSRETQPMAFLDFTLLEEFTDLDGDEISCQVIGDDGAFVGLVAVSFFDAGSGAYQARMTLDFDGQLGIAVLYALSMSETEIHFGGLSTSGESLTCTVSRGGKVFGEYEDLDPTKLGGSFSGSL